ncbi:MAG: hypothetical protein SNJ63_01820 [Sphingomonadaceae bacterium]
MLKSFLVVPFALAAATLAVPAAASTDVCAAAPAALRALAASADATAQRAALRDIQTGEALCEARNRPEAARKFRSAAKLLGTDLQTAMAGAATTASIQ